MDNFIVISAFDSKKYIGCGSDDMVCLTVDLNNQVGDKKKNRVVRDFWVEGVNDNKELMLTLACKKISQE